MLSKIKTNANETPKTIKYKISKNLLSLEDKDECLKTPDGAYNFIIFIEENNIMSSESVVQECLDVLYEDSKYSFYCARYLVRLISFLNIKIDINKCQEAACKHPEWAYEFAMWIPMADINKCQETACASPFYAYGFAKNVSGADIGKCQEAACQDPRYAYYFAKNIHGANIEKCQEAAYQDYYWAYCFARDIPGADKEKCRKICEGTNYAF